MEDVMRAIVNITPTDTPFMSGISKGKAAGTLHEWQRETLTTRSDNAAVEGSDFSYGTLTVPTRSHNVTQIFQKTYDVSSTERWVKKLHDPEDEFVRQKAKKLKEIATDIEHALLRGSKATGNASVARRLAGAMNYITTNYTSVASGTKLTESFYNGLLELSWIAGGDPDETYVGAMLKRVISGYTAGATKYVDTSKDKRLSNVIDVYESDFGLQKIFKCRDMLTGTNNCSIIIIQNDKWKMAIGEEVHVLPENEVAQSSHSKKGVLRGELTLESLAEEANASARAIDNKFN